jgi:hypothetical protein
MFRKTTLALAAVVSLCTAALIPVTADAHWSGWYGSYGWYGKSYGYPYWGGYGPRYNYGFYGPRHFYWGEARLEEALSLLLTTDLRAGRSPLVVGTAPAPPE